jgi:tRNA A-37 threonylcarbamoyl transferase component Bud32
MESLQPGQMLGPYQIINKVGQGGMATVYKAYQPSMDRNVAIKVLPGQLAESKEFVTRFQQEARIIARLEHPHILPVFDYGEDNGITYFVMRYLDAGTLKDKMESHRPLPLDVVDHLYTQLADALGYAHARGIVHRDLKPANALVDQDGNIFLTDFGIAKLLASASPRLTQTDAIMGTPAYISPEQAQAGPVDQRSDIYSLGIILYEMVTGRVPYTADTPLAVILKQVSDPLPLPSLIKPDIPPVIEQVLLKALAKNPNDRFASTAEFVAAWKRALKDVESVKPQEATKVTVPPVVNSTPPIVQTYPTQARAATTTQTQTRSTTGRTTTGLVIGCIAILCLALAAGGAFVFATGMLNPAPTATRVPPTATHIPPTPVPPTKTAVPATNAKTLLDDDFSQKNWGTLTNKDNAIEYVNKTLNMIVYTKNYFVWSTPNGTIYQNVHMEVTVTNTNKTDPTTAFGLMCDQQTKSNDFYYFAMTPAGQYAIAKAVSGEKDFFLTNNDKWEYSDAIRPKQSSYRVGADCASNGKLTFYVDGKVVDSVTDKTYTSGIVGLVTWSGEKATNTNVSFDDYVLTNLP